MKEIVPAVAVAVFNESNVLLVEHGEGAGHLTGVYGLPAGRIDEGESEIAAAARELHEETGLLTSEEDLSEFSDNVFTGTFSRKDGSEVTSTMKVYICKSYAGELVKTDETIPKWVDVSEVGGLELLPNVEVAVKTALKHSQNS